jgi:hypothetical protein
MGRWVLVFVLVLTGAARGQDSASASVSKETWGMFGVIGGEVLADGVTTRVLYQRHYNETDPIAQPFVREGVAGQVGGSLLAAAAMGGAWLTLRRMHHQRASKWFLRSVAVGEGCNVGRQFSILRTSTK